MELSIAHAAFRFSWLFNKQAKTVLVEDANMEKKKKGELILRSLHIILVKTKEAFMYRLWNKNCCDEKRVAPL